MTEWRDGGSAEDRMRVTHDRWDVIVAGSSFASMFFIFGLPRGLRVLVLEKGAELRHEEICHLYDDLYEPLAIQNRSDADIGFYDPYESSCANPLSIHAL